MGWSFPSFFFTKKKLATYGLHDSQMVPLFKCLSTNLWTSIISSWVSRSSQPGSNLGAWGSNSTAWSYMVWQGSRWDFCLSNTFLCRLYSFGRLVWVSFGCFRWIVTLLMKYRSWCVTTHGDTSLGTRCRCCLQADMERKCDMTGLLQPSSGSDSWVEDTEICIPRTRQLNLESFGDSKTTFYTTLPFQNLMSFQRHLFAHTQLRSLYSGPFYLWCSTSLPLPSSYITQTSYLYLISCP